MLYGIGPRVAPWADIGAPRWGWREKPDRGFGDPASIRERDKNHPVAASDFEFRFSPVGDTVALLSYMALLPRANLFHTLVNVEEHSELPSWTWDFPAFGAIC